MDQYCYDRCLDVKLSKGFYGDNIIIGIEANKIEEVNRCFNDIYNFNGCPAFTELEWIKEIPPNYFAKFQTNEKRFLGYLANRYIFDMLLNYPNKKETTRIRTDAIKNAINKYECIEEDFFLIDRNNFNL